MKTIATYIIAFTLLLIPTITKAAPTPDHLALPDLVAHADRWPATVTVNRDFHFTSGKNINNGDKILVDAFDGRQLYVENAGRDIRFIILPTDCDFLDAANSAWSALTPAQRALDPDALAADRSLWPNQIKLRTNIQTGTGLKIPAGTVLDTYGFSPQGVSALTPKPGDFVNIAYDATDAVERARQTLLIDVDKRPAWIVETLKPLLVDMTGKPYVDDHLDDKQFFLLYFSGKRCPRSVQISPRFVSMVADLSVKYPTLQAVLIAEDNDNPTMLQYMSDEKMPFPGVTPDDLQTKAPQFFNDYNKNIGLLPEMIVVDRFGNVLKDSDDHHGHYDPDTFLDQLPAFLAAHTAAAQPQ
jgi:hypothetical protein